ncbi:MAG: Crp/Fnr family transcriptional regulator [Ruminococcaceae bacterium]|nr:Crp/Fnr family transcriptional regulator [Oscillospiraceae bacterium]
MRKYLEILKKCPLFFNIEEENLLRMLACLGATIELYDKKYTVIPEGKAVKHIGIVLSGSVQISRTDYYGNRSILSNVYPSELFAEAFACAETQSMPVSIIANEPSYIMLIDCSHILHTCNNNCGFHQQLIFNLMKDIATKTVQFHQKIEIVSKRSTRDKLLTYLDMQEKKNGSNSFEIPFDRQELADYLEVERSGLSAEISKLRKEGILESDKKHFILL